MKKFLLLNTLALCLITHAADIQQTDYRSVTTEDALTNENEQENAIVEGHIVSFYIDSSIVVEDLTIITEPNQFYFVLNNDDKRIVTIGKTENNTLTVYNVTIVKNDAQDEDAETEIDAQQAEFPLDNEVDCESIEATFNKETRELVLFIPFATTETN
jgi:hypothetical protein